MKIIRATLNEVEKLSFLFDQYRQFYKQSSDIDTARIFLSERITNNESVIFLAMDKMEKAGIGFVQLYPTFSSVSMKRGWVLNDLFVHEDYRKQRVAEALINKSKELARETNSKGLVLETHSSNAGAQKLYDKTGFKKDNEHYYYYWVI